MSRLRGAPFADETRHHDEVKLYDELFASRCFWEERSWRPLDHLYTLHWQTFTIFFLFRVSFSLIVYFSD